MPIGMLDLSIVTDKLVRELNAAVASSDLFREAVRPTDPRATHDITVTGLAPDAARLEDGCQLSVYLFHVAPEAYNRNTYLREGTRARTVPELALPLTLHYLLTAHSAKSYVDEQRAMSIALKYIHEHPSMTGTVPVDGRTESFTMSLAAESVDEIGRIWQAINVPMRLSAVFRVSVVFVKPVARTVDPRPVERYVLDVEPLSQLPPTPVSASIAGSVITVTGSDFEDGELEVRFRGTTLSPSTGALADGQYRRLSSTQLELQPAPPLLPGRYPLWIGRRGLPVGEAWVEVP
jgi:Pvc16 N-terminal domain